MNASEEMILSRLRFVARRPERQDLASVVEAMLANAKVYNPRKCLLTACSTEAEEEARWPFMRGLKGSSARCIEAARKVVGKRMVEGLGIEPDWSAITHVQRAA